MPSSRPSSSSFLKIDSPTRSHSSVSKLLGEIEALVLDDEDGGPTLPPRIGLLEFGQRYFPQHCEHSPSRFHIDLASELDRIVASPDSQRTAIAAPRGSAKTTWVSLIFLTYCIVHDLKKYVVLITNTSSLANNLVRDVEHELDTNEDLARDYPHACGRGPLWREDELITRNGIKVQALGAGKRIRGRKFHQHRPDLFILDDLENDEQVRNPEQRDKMHEWLTKAVLNAKGLAKKADVFVIGTILHFDSVLARLLDERKSPGWLSMKYRSVIRFSDRPDLWEQWKALYTDFQRPQAERHRIAHEFYEANEGAMLEGTEVLWLAAETYYDLMRIRIDHGPIAFDSEKQNEPIDPSACHFPEAWFEWFDISTTGGETWLIPKKGEPVKLSDCDVYGAVDPSMGKLDKHRDPSAIVAIAAYPAGKSGGEYSSYWVIDADIQRRHPHIIARDILDLHRQRRFVRVGIEAIQFQELFADDVSERAPNLHIVKLKPHGDKKLRIEKLAGLIYNGRLRFHSKLTTLYDQLRYWPQAPHDDGPDAIELCMQTINREGWQAVDLDSSEPDEKELSSEDQQLRAAMPWIYEPCTDVCGTCIWFGKRANGEAMCELRNSLITPKSPACDAYDLSPDHYGSE